MKKKTETVIIEVVRFVIDKRLAIATALYFAAGFLYSLGGDKPPKPIRKRR